MLLGRRLGMVVAGYSISNAASSASWKPGNSAQGKGQLSLVALM